MKDSFLESTRYEIKFVADITHLHSLRHWLRLNAAGLSTAYPSRQVNNIYFDTHEFSAYAQNLSGVSSRRKIRYRWYGNSLMPLPGSLEIKSRRNQLGWKTIFPIKFSPYKEGCTWQTFKSRLRDQLPENRRHVLDDNPQVVLINSYHRDYFVSGDKKISVTLDSQQFLLDQHIQPKPNFKHKTNMPEIIVLEIKCAGKNRDLAVKLAKDIPLRVSRHSKYVVGTKSILGR